MTDLEALTTGTRERELVERVQAGEVPDPFPFFVKLQIQTTSFCNARCGTCPYPEVEATESMGRMSEELFDLVLAQIRGRGVERVSLFLMNEPLVDRRLPDFTQRVRAVVPEALVTIITNGTLLSAALARELAASGMGEISVSVNGFDPSAYEHLMAGLDYDRVIANLEEVGAAQRRGELGDMSVRVVALDIGDAAEQAENFRSRTGLDVYLKPVTNRAGSIDADRFRRAPLAAAPRLCQRPFVKGYVLYNGDLVLCNCDWKRTTIIGNVRERPLAELWQDAVLADIRRQHARGSLRAGTLCAGCDYPYVR